MAEPLKDAAFSRREFESRLSEMLIEKGALEPERLPEIEARQVSCELCVDGPMRALVAERPSESTILKAALENGFTTLWEDGVEKLQAGITTPRELLRVAARSSRASR